MRLNSAAKNTTPKSSSFQKNIFVEMNEIKMAIAK